MRTIENIKESTPHRRIVADLHNEDAIELDVLEAKLGINRAVRSKGERDAAIVDIALLSLKKHVEAYSGLTGNKYPSYTDIAAWLESGKYLHQFSEFLIHRNTPENLPMQALTHNSADLPEKPEAVHGPSTDTDSMAS